MPANMNGRPPPPLSSPSLASCPSPPLSRRKASTKHSPSEPMVSVDGGDMRADAADAIISVQTRLPGPNSFAQAAYEHNRYLLASNSFAQKQFSRREGTPPGMLHPAFRPGFNLLDFEKPVPKLDAAEIQRYLAAEQQQRQRASEMTTMSPFLAAGQEESPEFNLGTTPDHTPQPTPRAWIEDRREEQIYQQTGSGDERVPVFKHTPKPASAEFHTPHPAPVKKTEELKKSEQQSTPATKSPKKSFFSRLGWSRGKMATGLTLLSSADAEEAANMGPKARAVLVSAPPKRGLERSPSKPNGFFSRRTSDATEAATPSISKRPDPPRAATSLGHRTPQHITFHLGRSESKKLSKADHAAAGAQTAQNTLVNKGVHRSQSLKYLDHSIPPTPPAKDTPPDDQAIRNVSQQTQPIVTFDNDTPTRTKGFLSASGRISPSRVGSYGNRGEVKLVTQPSMYSLRASVVPESMEESAFKDAKSRLNALGIEGFNMPHETRREESKEGNADYSPSVYSPDGFRNSVLHFPERAPERVDKKDVPKKPWDRHDAMRETSDMVMRETSHVQQDSMSTSATSGTIPVIYPELAKDPSIASFMSYGQSVMSSPPQPGAMDQAFVDIEQMVNDSLKVVSPTTPSSGSSEGDNLFSIPLKHKGHGYQSSPMSHQSAKPSPLRIVDGLEYLPRTTYKPSPSPLPKSRKETKSVLRLPKVKEEMKPAEDSLVDDEDLPFTPGGRPKPKPSLFDNKPALAIPQNLVVRHSPPIGGAIWTERDKMYGDPQKSTEACSPSPRKSSLPPKANASATQQETGVQIDPSVDNVIAMLKERDSIIEKMSNSVQADNARLHQRLASLEIRLSEPKPEICYGGGENGSHRSSKRVSLEKKGGRRQSSPHKRISTSYAREYYNNSGDDGKSPVDSVTTTEESATVPTPNLPQNVSIPLGDSPALSGTFPTDSTQVAAGTALPAAGTGDPNYNQLLSMFQQQQMIMMQMMEEIRDLKTGGGGNGSGSSS